MTLLDFYRQHTGYEPKKEATTGGGEWHGTCPGCGGKDRFRIQPNNSGKRCIGFFACRQCDLKGDTISFCIDVMGMTPEQAYDAANAKPREKPFLKPVMKQSFVPNVITSPSAEWIERAASFVNWAHERIFEQSDVLHWLEKRGLPLDAVKKFKLGWCANDKSKNGYFKCERSAWGLPDEIDETGELKGLYLPRGLVVPSIEKDGSVTRIKIRRSDWNPDSEFPKYKAIPGSMSGLMIVGDTSNKLMVIVESELDALAIDFACSDFAFAVGVGSNSKNPDNVTDYLAQRKTLLICRDNDDAGKTMFYKWRKLYMHASDHPTPIGKDIGEAIQQGLNIREWLLYHLSCINLKQE